MEYFQSSAIIIDTISLEAYDVEAGLGEIRYAQAHININLTPSWYM